MVEIGIIQQLSLIHISGEKMVAYPFEGYWKDVGTIDSLWEANMDLLDPNVPLDVWESDWKIYSRTSGRPGHYISEHAHVDNSMLTEGCLVEGAVCNSILFAGVSVGRGAMVESSILMPGAVVEEGDVYKRQASGFCCGRRPASALEAICCWSRR